MPVRSMTCYQGQSWLGNSWWEQESVLMFVTRVLHIWVTQIRLSCPVQTPPWIIIQLNVSSVQQNSMETVKHMIEF